MRPENMRPRNLGIEDLALADFKRQMRAKHRQRRQAPQRDQQLSRDTTLLPVAATDQYNEEDNACSCKADVSRSAQCDEVGIVLVDSGEDEQWSGEPDRKEADTSDDLHDGK